MFLTAKRIEKLTEPGRHRDGKVPGLFLQIGDGSRCWVLRYQRGGPERMLGLGPLSLVSLEEARERAIQEWKKILDGNDPVAARQARHQNAALTAAKVITFDECAAQYIAAHRPGWSNVKHSRQWEKSLALYASPVLGALPVAQIDEAHVLKVVQPIWSAKTETAERVRRRIAAVLDYAEASKLRIGPNPARWKANFEHLLPAKSKVKKLRHHAALGFDLVPAFVANLRARKDIGAAALEILVLTAARAGEVTGARWPEVDLGARLWTVPAERMKARRVHRVALSERAVEILKSLPREAGNDYLFIGARAGKSLSHSAFDKLMSELAPGFVAHGFRSSFRDWCGERTNFPREIAEGCLAHAIGTAVERAYARGDMLEKRRRVMEAWAAFCSTPVRRGDVVPMPTRRIAK
jgi:integrase